MIQQSVQVAFCGFLAYQLEPLLEILETHLADFDGECLPNLWMADVCEAIIRKEIGENDYRRLMTILDTEFAKGREAVRDLIGASFVEHLPIPSEGGSEFVKGFKALEVQYKLIFGAERGNS